MMQSLIAERWTHGERRQLTVLTCDMVNSVGLSTRYDPEDLAEIVSKYQSCCEDVVRQFDGYVARFTGDGLKAYFGYPCANEYDPERAVRAGLALIAAVGNLRLRPDLVLSTRVGIATGDVVVGEMIGAGEAQERTVAGETPNLAARLQVLGQPDTVVISDTTKQLVGRLFKYDDMGRNALKGFRKPVQTWRVLAEGPTVCHFEAVRSESSLTPLVGRAEEMTFLRHRWLQAKGGKGQVVLLAGEAGVGKSRLTIAFRGSLASEPFWDLRHYCSPYHQNTSLYPMIRQLEQSALVSPDDGPETKLRKLEILLTESGTDIGVMPVFAALLSIPTEQPALQPGFSPGQQKRRLLSALENRLVALASKAPLLLVFEDVHWIDPSTREFLDRLIHRVPELPILLVITTRPETKSAWQSNPKITVCDLERLSRRDSQRVVGALDSTLRLEPKVLEQILDHSDGLPLFLEELTKTALKSECDRPANQNGAAPEVLRVPRTLHDSLLARLDRLGPWKCVAQTGAVIGRCFSFKLLSALIPQSPAALAKALQGLVRAELITVRGRPPEATYTFRHALLQEAASSCLLNADRRAIHRRIAEVLESDFPGTAANEPELLALHYTGAGLVDRAIDYWQLAGERALQRSANVEAAHHLDQALALLGTLPPSADRDQRELTLQTRLGATLTTVKGFAAPEVAAVYERARGLSRGSQPPLQRFSVLRGLWVYDLVRAEWQGANDLAKEMLSVSRDPGQELEAHRALGMTLLWSGNFSDAHAHLEQGLRIYDPKHHHIHAFQYGNDPGIACQVHRAFALWVLGYPDRALSTCREALALARRLAHPFTLGQALIYSMFIHQLRGEPEALQELVPEAKSLAAEHGFPFWLAEADIMNGWAQAAGGEAEAGINQICTGMTSFLATGAKMDKPRWLALLAEAYSANNQTREGLKTVQKALKIVGSTKECFYQARLCQIHGDLLLKEGSRGAATRAATVFQQGLEVARRQKARSWELSTATSLARLWCAQAKRHEAYDLLAPVLQGFKEGSDTADLKEARALLNELA